MGTILLAALVALLAADPAVPPFDLGMSAHPVAGRPATVVVVFAEDVPADDVEEALAIVWAGDYRGRPLDEATPRLGIEWTRTGARRFEGVVTFPRPGEWLIVALPDRASTPPPVYADTITVTVGLDSTSSNWMLVAIGAAIAGVGLALRGTRRGRRPAVSPRPRRRSRHRF